MKSKIINVITKSNQVIFFVGSLLFVIFLATMLIKEMMRPSYSNRGVEIAREIDGENTPIDIKYEKNYFRSIKDIHIIKVTSEKIMINEDRTTGKVLSLFSGGYDERNTVNLIFSPESGSNTKLFENDLLITSVETARFENVNMERARYEGELERTLLDKNIYLVVKSDSNGDGYLKDDDNKDLYLSDYNGNNLELIMSDIQTSRVIADNRLLILKLETGVTEMYLYDIIGNKMTKLNTDISK